MDVLKAHLPKLLDVASSFDIDLGGILADYVNNIRGDTSDFSFPEAALLIQQCSEIYARKVDHVHALTVELSENMNSRMYSETPHHVPDQPSDAPISPRKAPRRRKTVASTTTEDFHLQNISLVKSNTLKSTRAQKKKMFREPVCVPLVKLNLRRKNEFHIYEEEQYAPIGTKDQFRINWPIHENSRLEENITPHISSILSDMRTQNTVIAQTNYDKNVESIMQNIDEADHVACADNMNGEFCERENSLVLGSTIPLLSGNNVRENIHEIDTGAVGEIYAVDGHVAEEVIKKRLKEKSTFKLPYELTVKGTREAKPEKNFTMFLFSNMLKRILKMPSSLPPPLKGRNADKKLIKKHVSFLQKRFDLAKRKPVNILDSEADFFGFEEVVLPDVPEVLTAIFCDDIEEIHEAEQYQEPVSSGIDDDSWEENNCIAPDIPAIDLNMKRKSAVDTTGVSDWRKFIQGKLSAEETERPFDVHEYGTNIINKFSKLGETLSFDQVVGGSEAKDVCRYFVSTLMLANTTNLLLSDDQEKINTLKLTLQHKERSHDMEDFLVPPSVGRDTSKQSKAQKSSASPPSCSKSTSEQTVKRKLNLKEKETAPSRYKKQMSGVGPWRNKSKHV